MQPLLQSCCCLLIACRHELQENQTDLEFLKWPVTCINSTAIHTHVLPQILRNDAYNTSSWSTTQDCIYIGIQWEF